MNFIKNLTKKKYFYVIFFFCLIVVFAFMLHLVIQKDIQSGKPTDDFPRATAQVINAPNSYALTQDGVTKEYYSNILIHVEINENEAYDAYLVGQVEKAVSGPIDTGSVITVKYEKNDHAAFYYANDPKPHYRVFLYVFFGVLIAMSIGATIYASKAMDVLTHRRKMKDNMEKMQREKEQSAEDASRYMGADGNEHFGDYRPFNDQGIDYNKLYEENQTLNDAAYNAESTYAGYNNDAVSDNTSNSYGAPNPSMDAPYDPNASYGGYGAPNPSMDAPYDPNASYGGYGAPNPSMDAPYDPNKPYP